MSSLEETIKEIKKAEMEVLERIDGIAGKEMSKIKSAINSINQALKTRDCILMHWQTQNAKQQRRPLYSGPP